MTRLAVALLLVAGVLGTSACASSHHRTSVAPMPGTVPSTPPHIAIARVQASNLGKGFGFFPNAATKAGCLIPGPGISRGIKGMCQTEVISRTGSEGPLVTFTETWPARRFRTGGPPRGTLRHSWRFELRPNGRVVFIGTDGDFPPQMAE